MKDRVILADCDGVLLDWETSFGKFMANEGYKITHPDYKRTYNLGERYGIDQDEKLVMVRKHNESEAMKTLAPHRDAVEFVKKIHHEHDYRFLVITSMSDDPTARRYRIQNLRNVFGDVFEDFIFLDTGADKDAVLSPFADTGCFWIEDKAENAQAGLDVGLRSLIMEHGFNMHSTVAPRIKNWQQFYDDYIV